MPKSKEDLGLNLTRLTDLNSLVRFVEIHGNREDVEFLKSYDWEEPVLENIWGAIEDPDWMYLFLQARGLLFTSLSDELDLIWARELSHKERELINLFEMVGAVGTRENIRVRANIRIAAIAYANRAWCDAARSIFTFEEITMARKRRFTEHRRD